MTAPIHPRGYRQVLGWLDLTLFSACAIIVLDGLGPSASIGASSIAWYAITLVILFIPYGLIIAELGSTFPTQGGLYVWIQLAFGDRWAARSAWFYWVNVALGMPSVYVLFGSMLSQLFFPSLGMPGIILTGIAMTWITVLVSVLPLSIGRWVPNLGAGIKTVVILVLGIGGAMYAFRHGIANDLSIRAMIPTWNTGVAFLPVIVFNFLGFELMSGAGQEMKNPGRDIPVAIFISGILTTGLYLCATTGILMALPLEQLSLVRSMIDALKIILGDAAGGGAFVLLLGSGILFTFFATMTTWTIGVNRVAAQAAESGWLPACLGKRHPVTRNPVSATLITGMVSTLVLIAYGLIAANNDQLFWTLFAFGSIIFLLPYLFLFPAFLKLRASHADQYRPYLMPGGQLVAWAAVAVCMAFIAQAILLFIWVPGFPVNWASTSSILGGVVLTILVGEILVRVSERK
ncbi:MAG: APC family permease [Anaerolineaceae bacterium]|nr:APC family permease [Anaerolineaceae bacterium]